MTNKKEDINLGYELEDELKKVFKVVQSNHPFFWHQFVDTKAARNFVAAQPSDFMVASLHSEVYLLEAKASVLKKSLASCAKSAISPSQIGMHKKWHRAGNKSLFIFFCEIDDTVELWDGKYVVDCISDGERMNVLGGEHLVAKCSYFELEKMFIKFLGVN